MKESTSATGVKEVAKTPEKTGLPRRRAPRQQTDLGEGASAAARRLAAVILEVLAGARTPGDAAGVLGVALPRYYALEVRALHGMLVACEPRGLGRTQSPESALASLRRECEQLRRECGRQQALVRVAQRTMGLSPPVATETKGKKRRRRPLARALRAAARLKGNPSESVAVMATAEN